MAISTDFIDPNLEFLDASLLDADMEREIKLLFLGEPDAGKTSMIQLFFNDENPKTFLTEDIAPTIGAEIRVFDYKNAKVGVFDLAGQEIDRWLDISNGELFYETDAIILCFNLDHDLKKRNYEETITKVHKMIDEFAPQARLIILLNRYDEFVESRRGTLQKANKIKYKMENLYQDPTYITSLISNYFPLLRMKLERLLQVLPVNPPSIDYQENIQLQNVTQVNGENHVIPSLRLADVRNLPQSEYDEIISRSEILQSEFSIR